MAEGLMLSYEFALPAPRSLDVMSREIHVFRNGIEDIYNVPKDDVRAIYSFQDGTPVRIYIVDVDEAGNRSANGEALEFTANDTIPPMAPAAPEILSVNET